GPTNEPKTTKSPEAGINRQRSDQTDDHEKSGLGSKLDSFETDCDWPVRGEPVANGADTSRFGVQT
ncbi:hypothetical protein, partial [Arthrobacter sp. CAN_A1]|uniref:hypothetical protein n=1 Tax=Arthrobacter sp. CAN_A1 TaxID=2787717 RepID=UPI002FD61385